jgi:hypothetical protein
MSAPLMEPWISLALNAWVELFKRFLPTTPNSVSLALFWGLTLLALLGLAAFLDRFLRKPGWIVGRIEMDPRSGTA